MKTHTVGIKSFEENWVRDNNQMVLYSFFNQTKRHPLYCQCSKYKRERIPLIPQHWRTLWKTVREVCKEMNLKPILKLAKKRKQMLKPLLLPLEFQEALTN